MPLESKQQQQPLASLPKPKPPPLKRTPTPPAPYKGKGSQVTGLQEPAATSTPVQAKAEHTPKKDRREKAQLKSASPSQLGRPRAPKQVREGGGGGGRGGGEGGGEGGEPGRCRVAAS